MLKGILLLVRQFQHILHAYISEEIGPGVAWLTHANIVVRVPKVAVLGRTIDLVSKVQGTLAGGTARPKGVLLTSCAHVSP